MNRLFIQSIAVFFCCIITAYIPGYSLSPEIPYIIIGVYPHDPQAFCQGLVYNTGFLYESTGLYGHSSLRKVEPQTGKLVKALSLPANQFSEGLTLADNKLIQLTWKEKTGFVRGREDFSVVRTFSYATEGWGLTYNGNALIMSDGSDLLYFLDPDSFSVIKTLRVKEGSRPVRQLNELEYVHGTIFANIWQGDSVALISEKTGQVESWLNFKGLLKSEESQHADLLNGIAYNPDRNSFYITGKLWPKLFEIKLSK